MMQMDKTSRNAIVVPVPVDRLPEGVLDTNRNDNDVPKEDVMGEWTTIPTKTQEGLFDLAFYIQAANKGRHGEVQGRHGEVWSDIGH